MIPDRSFDLAISLQVRGAETEPWNGHLAAGVLLDADVVLVPSPPDLLLDPLREFEVVVIPMPLRPERTVERIRPTRIDVLYVGGMEEPPACAIIKLAAPSRYPIMVAAFDECELNRALEQYRGDLWTSLEWVGAIPTGLRDGPPTEVLRRLPEVELEQRRPLQRQFVLDVASGGTWPWPWCLLTPRCEPCNEP